MAEEVENQSESFEDKVSNVEQFVEDKKKPLLIGGGVVLALGAILLYVFLMWIPSRNTEAQKAMYMAEFAFGKDSFQLALNGRAMGTAPFAGFAEISSKYSFTKAANLANYYAGICCLNLKKYDEAVTYLNKFSTKDPVIGAVALNATGDAYAEQNKMDDAVSYYEKAANFSDNESYTPMFLLKAGNALERQKKYADAKGYYEKIKEKYPNSEEGRDIEKYIARASAAQ